MQQFSVKIFMITIAVVTSFTRTRCYAQEMTDFVNFKVYYSEINRNEAIIICHNDWNNNLSSINLDLSSCTNILFKNCSLPETVTIQSILRSLKIKITSQITFYALQSIPSRKNLAGLSVPRLSFSDSNFTELPFDLFYDVINVEVLDIGNTQLARFPEAFFDQWAENITDVDMTMNELKKIAKNDFSRLQRVNSIDLTQNKISDIEYGAFDHLINLHTLKLDNNLLRTLPNGIFHHLRRLAVLDLSRNLFDEIPQDLLVNTKSLMTFTMHTINGNLSTLPPSMFKNLIYLDEVKLATAQLKSLPSDLFVGCTQLGHINLSNNQLRNIPSDLLNDAKSLRSLVLESNRLESLPAHIFEGFDQFVELNINKNQLTSLGPEILEDLKSLQWLHASDNNLTRLDDHFLMYLKSAFYINLSNNQITFGSPSNIESSEYQNRSYTVDSRNRNFNRTSTRLDIDLRGNRITEFNARLIDILKYSEEVDLSRNQITKMNFTDFSLETVSWNETEDHGPTTTRYLSVDLGLNPLHCDCHLVDFVRYLNGWRDNELYRIFLDRKLTCASPSEFEKQKVRDIALRDMNCLVKTSDPNDVCNETCICREYPEKQVLAVDCSHRNLTQLPPMIRNVHNWSIELNMTGNMLQHSPSLKSPYWNNVTSLDLSNNDIFEVTIDLFSPTLKNLKLHGNSLSRLDSNIIDYLANDSLRNVTLHDNKWICDCEAQKLVTFVQKKYTHFNFHEMTCYGTNKKLYKMTVSELCEDMVAMIVIASLLIAFTGILMACLAAFYYKYQQEIRVWLYSKQWCLWLVTEDELDKDKEYDAFISFSHKDEDFVEKEIVAKLESGSKPYKLCLHYRDWLAGEWIPVQISRSVAESRRTIVILTPNFLESVWGLLEFRAAHTQALKDGRNRVIVILYGEIGNMDELDQEMKDYLKLNTYIKWGDPWFWDKLRYALPHAKKPMMRNADIIKNYSIEVPLTNNIELGAGRLDVTPTPKYTTSADDSVNLLNASTENKRAMPSY